MTFALHETLPEGDYGSFLSTPSSPFFRGGDFASLASSLAG